MHEKESLLVVRCELNIPSAGKDLSLIASLETTQCLAEIQL